MSTQPLSIWQNRRSLCANIGAVSDRRDGREQIDFISALATKKVWEIWWLPTTLVFHWAAAQAKRTLWKPSLLPREITIDDKVQTRIAAVLQVTFPCRFSGDSHLQQWPQWPQCLSWR